MTRRVSTGRLPDAALVAALVDQAHERFRTDDDGAVSTVYPALARADRNGFGLAITSADGTRTAAGEALTGFTIMSVSKPFVLALVAQARGLAAVRALVGSNATGLPFSSAVAIEQGEAGRTNPMVNPGAIATSSLAPGSTTEQRWDFLRSGLAAFAGRELALDQEVVGSALRTNHRNRGLAWLLAAHQGLAGDPEEAVDLYTRQCCLTVSATDLAVMGATLADGGVNPVSGEQVVAPEVARAALAMMAVAGLYETSGDWLVDVGVPAKSGISGGLVAVSPGKGALGVWSPPLDRAGNSVRGQRAAAFLAAELGLDLFAAGPV
jgi:glutaminase